MKQSEVKDLTGNDLKEKLIDETNNLFRLTTSHAVSPVENPLKIRVSRRTIARIKTEMRKRELKDAK